MTATEVSLLRGLALSQAPSAAHWDVAAALPLPFMEAWLRSPGAAEGPADCPASLPGVGGRGLGSSLPASWGALGGAVEEKQQTADPNSGPLWRCPHSYEKRLY